jgi:MtN3 and saliva related transmembrane protein
MTTIIGTLAAILTTSAMFPQALRIIKTKDVVGISLLMYIINSLGIIAWFTYGLMIDSKPIIFANVVAIVPAVTILYLKLKLSTKPV